MGCLVELYTRHAGGPLRGDYLQAGLEGGGRAYDVTPDGQRFLMIKEGGDEPTAPQNLIVVLNWFEELRRRVPVP